MPKVKMNSRNYPNLYAIVDDDDYENVCRYRWHPKRGKNTFYANTHIRRSDGSYTKRFMHQIITGFAVTDHKNGNGLDNQRHNLRDATHSGNQANRHVAQGSSPFKGVSWHKGKNTWTARITVNRRLHHLGDFDSEVSAARAYDAAARMLFGSYAATNEDLGLYDD